MPEEESLLKRIGCEMVSKATLRSRNMRMESKPESAAMRGALVNFMRAVSVLRQGWKLDWKGSSDWTKLD